MAEKARALVGKGKNLFILACIAEDLANYYGHESNITKAKALAEESIRLYLKSDPRSVYKVYSYLGAVYNELGEYEQALRFCHKGIEYWERYKDIEDYRTVDLYNYTAVTYRSLRKYKEALKYFKKAVSIAEKLGNEAALAFYEGNAAETAIFAGNTVDARRFLQSIEDKSYLANDPLYANALTVLLQSYIMLRSYNKADKAAALILRQYNSFDGMPDEQWAKSKFSSALFELPPNSV